MTRMTVTRFAIVTAALIALQAVVFAYLYEDLLFLRQPVDAVTLVPAQKFRAHADEALQRSRLTRDHLETIVAASLSFGDNDLEVRALRRLALDYPDDDTLRLRLADALRRAKYFDQAEQLYLAILEDSQ